MARIKIENLPKNVNIGKEEMKSIMGGQSTLQWLCAKVCSWIDLPSWLAPQEDNLRGADGVTVNYAMGYRM